MSSLIGALRVTLGLDTAAFEKGATAAEKRAKSMQRELTKMGKNLTEMGKTLTVGVTTPLVAFGYEAVKAARESEDAFGQVQASLKSMGNASQRTAGQLALLAKSEVGTSLYHQDQILRDVTANLLTFRNISGDTFDKTQQAVLDVATKMKRDLLSTTIQLGKALNDPVKGMVSLRREGIQFAPVLQDQIKTMVKAGNIAGAQAVMLGELKRQFGGAAEAARKSDPFGAFSQSWHLFEEEVGAKIIPLLTAVTGAVVMLLDAFNRLSPGMQEAVVVAGILAAGLGPVLVGVGGILTLGAPLVGLLVRLAPAIALVGRALLVLAMNPYVLGLAAVVLGIYLAWKNWDKIEPVIVRLYTAVKTWLLDKLGAVWNGIKKGIDTVEGYFRGLYDAVVGHSYVPDMVDGIAAQMARLDAVMVAPAGKAASKTAKAFGDLAGNVRQLLDQLFPLDAAFSEYTKNQALLDKAEKAGILTPSGADRARMALAGQYRQTLDQAMPQIDFGPNADSLVKDMGNVDTALAKLTGHANDNTVRIAKSFKDMANETLGALDKLAQAIKSGGFLNILDAVLGLGLQLGSIGLFGSKVQTNINASVPHYAAGTGFHPGGLALVGERGPELVNLPRGSSVTPNSRLAGVSTVHVIPSPYFDVVVDGRVAARASLIARAGGEVGVQRMQYRQTRRI